MWRSTALGLLERISTFTVCFSGLDLLNVFIGLQGNKLRKHLRNHWFQNVHFPDEQQEIIMNTQLRTLHKKVLDKWQVVRQRQEEKLKREEVEDLTPLRVGPTKICVSCWLRRPVLIPIHDTTSCYMKPEFERFLTLLISHWDVWESVSLVTWQVNTHA